MKKPKPPTGSLAFEEYYRTLFDSRWEALRKALLQETKPHAFSIAGGKPYYLDKASIYAAEALPPLQKGCCLDMCAAPGGKTLVLTARMGSQVQITANELSRSRRSRLLKVLDDHLPAADRNRITVTGWDAAVLPRIQTTPYHRILLDAPCSSERHVLTNPKYLSCWTPARIKMLAHRQWALLSAAFLLLKEGGFLVYATCALTDIENDGTVQRLLKKYGQMATVHHLELPVYCEKTSFGCRFLPDVCNGAGPLYFSLIEKTPGTSMHSGH